jgi:hypothetical protein
MIADIPQRTYCKNRKNQRRKNQRKRTMIQNIQRKMIRGVSDVKSLQKP